MGFMDSDGGIGATLFSEDEIESRIKELGAEITADYQGRRPLLVCVLRGAYALSLRISDKFFETTGSSRGARIPFQC